MAEQTLTDYLTGTLNFPEPLRAAINANGITTFDDLRDYPQDELGRLIKAIREPGGMIANPNRGARQPQRIRNPGTQVMDHQERRLRRLAFYCFHRYYHLQSPVQPEQATLGELNRIWGFHLQYEANKDKEVPMPEKYKSNKLKETLDATDHCLSQSYGAIGLPLIYLIRDEVEPPEEDPPAQPTIVDMLRRARHNGQYYAADNKQLWDILYAVFFGTDGWTWISSFQATNDGRRAYLAFQAHFLGDGVRNVLYVQAEQRLKALHYEGERRNFTWHTYTTAIKKEEGDIYKYGTKDDRHSQFQQVRQDD